MIAWATNWSGYLISLTFDAIGVNETRKKKKKNEVEK